MGGGEDGGVGGVVIKWSEGRKAVGGWVGGDE